MFVITAWVNRGHYGIMFLHNARIWFRISIKPDSCGSLTDPTKPEELR